jgi:hypothetical protein
MLPTPEIIRCFHDARSRLPAMELRWPAATEQAWRLPDGTIHVGPAPTAFGITIHRLGVDAYLVRCLWNDRDYCWSNLTGRQLHDTSLDSILAALGTSLDYLLDQPLLAAA